MSDEIKVVYEGVDIEYNEHDGEWIGGNMRAAKLKDIKNRIDSDLKKAFKRQPAICPPRWGHSTYSNREDGKV